MFVSIVSSRPLPEFLYLWSWHGRDLINRIVHRLADKKVELTKEVTSDIETLSESLRANFISDTVRS